MSPGAVRERWLQRDDHGGHPDRSGGGRGDDLSQLRRKAGLIETVVEAAAGDAERAEVPPEERSAIRRLIEEPDPRRKLALYAAAKPGIHERAGRLRRALREAAQGDLQLLPVLERIEAQR